MGKKKANLSELASVITSTKYNYNFEEIKLLLKLDVHECLDNTYKWIISELNRGKTIDELIVAVEELKFNGYEDLEIEDKTFIKNDARKVLALRKERND